jgi:GNAT superfamily N-acetyltransferase
MNRPLFLGEPSFDPGPFVASRYEPIAWYASALADNASQIENSEPDGSRLRTEGWRLVGLDSLGGFSKALPHLHQVTSASFSEAHSYSPIGRELFEALYAPLETRIDPRLVRFALSPEDEVAGYCFSIPDLLNPDLREFIVKTLAVHPRWRRYRLGSWMVGEAHREAEAAGYTGGGIHALMWSGSHSQSISNHGGQLLRRYALFERDLS